MLPPGLAGDCIYEHAQADRNDRPHGRNLPGERRLEAEWLQHDCSDREGQPHAALQRSGGYLGLDPVRLRSWLRQGRGHAHFGGRLLLCLSSAFPSSLKSEPITQPTVRARDGLCQKSPILYPGFP